MKKKKGLSTNINTISILVKMKSILISIIDNTALRNCDQRPNEEAISISDKQIGIFVKILSLIFKIIDFERRGLSTLDNESGEKDKDITKQDIEIMREFLMKYEERSKLEVEYEE
jgi:hypothetical protein